MSGGQRGGVSTGDGGRGTPDTHALQSAAFGEKTGVYVKTPTALCSQCSGHHLPPAGARAGERGGAPRRRRRGAVVGGRSETQSQGTVQMPICYT
eukprot:gene7222-biopygen22515